MSKTSKAILSCLLKIKHFLIMIVSISTIHGFNHITKRGYHPAERIIWMVLVAVAAYEIVNISKISLDRYTENPTVISMERDRYSWNTSFPTITVCPSNKVNEPLLENYLKTSDIKNKDQYRKFVTTLLNATYENLDQIIEYENVTGDDFLGIIKKFRFKFLPSISTSFISTEIYHLQMSLSELGVCYSFNSQLAVYNSPEYWENNTWNLIPQNSTIYVNPIEGEVYAALINMSSGSQAYFHGPYEVPDIASKYIRMKENTFMQIYVSGLTIFTSNRAKRLGINQRKCRMYDESNLRHSPVYSYVLCRMDCRARLSKTLCGCIPHFYRNIGNDAVCSFAGLKCLHKFKDQLIQIKEECTCLANCEDVNFVVSDWDTREWFLGTLLQWGVKEYPKMRLKRDIIFGFSDLLVYTGGVAGLFLGCSVLSFIEILYFLTLRLYWFIVRHESTRKLQHI